MGLRVRALSGVFVCFGGQVSTSGLAEENEAPDTGGAADDQAHRQHRTVRNLAAQPAHKEEAHDDLHPTQAVHQAVAQLAEAEVALRQRCHHGLGGGGEKFKIKQKLAPAILYVNLKMRMNPL